MRDYSDKVEDYFFNPRNAGLLADANAVGEVGSMACGDALRLMLRVNPDTQVIEDARFQTFGCGSAIASSSALTELVIGKTVDEARAVTSVEIAGFLGSLSPEKMYCAVMGQEALSRAIANWTGEALSGGALVCRCFGVGAGVIERAIRTNRLTTPEMVTFYTKAGGSCSGCREGIEAILTVTNRAMVEEGLIAAKDAFGWSEKPKRKKPEGFVMPSTPPARLMGKPAAPKPAEPQQPVAIQQPDPIQIAPLPAKPRPAPATVALADVVVVEKPADPETSERDKAVVAEVIESMRAIFRRDGGDVQMVGIRGNIVHVRLSGACAMCQLASQTLGGLQGKIVEALGRPMRVIPVPGGPVGKEAVPKGIVRTVTRVPGQSSASKK